MSPAEHLEVILTTAGIVGGGGWSSRIGGSTGAAKTVTLIDHGGREGEAKVAIDYPAVQIIVEGASSTGGYSAAYNQAQAIYDELHGIDTPNADWGGLVSCLAVHRPQWLGRNDQERPKFSINFRIIAEPDSPGNRTY